MKMAMRVNLVLAVLVSYAASTSYDEWSVDDVVNFVQELGSSPRWKTIASTLKENEYDGLVFASLTVEDLQELDIPKQFAVPLLRIRDQRVNQKQQQRVNVQHRNMGRHLLQGGEGEETDDAEEVDGAQNQCLTAQVVGLTEAEATRSEAEAAAEAAAAECAAPCRDEFDDVKQEQVSLGQEVEGLRRSGLDGGGSTPISWPEGTNVWKNQLFETGVDGWSERNGVTPVQDCTTSFEGFCSLRFPRGWGRNWEGETNKGQTGTTVGTFPYICFAYKLPPTTELNILVDVGGWKSIIATKGLNDSCETFAYPKIGFMEPGLVQDNKWHHACYNLRDAEGVTDSTVVNSFIWHWPHDGCSTTESTSAGGMYPNHIMKYTTQHTFWIDAFSVTDKLPEISDGFTYDKFHTLTERVLNLEQSIANIRFGRSEPGIEWPADAKFFKYQKFEEGTDGWSERNGVTPVQDCTSSYEGTCSLRFASGWGRNFEGGTNGGPYTPAEYPYMCFAYKIGKDTHLNMLVNDGTWKSVVLSKALNESCQTWDYPKIGFMAPGIEQDEEWHYKCYDMREATSAAINSIIWHWPHSSCTYPPHSNEANASVHTFWIDAFAIVDRLPVGYNYDGKH